MRPRRARVAYSCDIGARLDNRHNQMTATGPPAAAELPLGEVLAALSLAADLESGMPLESSLRMCVIATAVGRTAGLGAADLSDTYYTALLRWIGWTAFASETAAAYGNDITFLRTFLPLDISNEEEVAQAIRTNLAREELPHVRAMAVERFFASGKMHRAQMASAAVAVSVRLADRLPTGAAVSDALTQIWERCDGRGLPRGLVAEELCVAARLVHLASAVEVDHRTAGRQQAVEKAVQRSKGWFDPVLVDAFVDVSDELFGSLERESVWDMVLESEPAPRLQISSSILDTVTSVFADHIDLKSFFTIGHSSGVARLAGGAGELLGVPVSMLRQAGHLHDLGRVSVSSAIWNKPGPLATSEWERVRLHTYYGERILTQSPLLVELGGLVGLHHERLDGSGYHRGARGDAVGPAARVLAAANIYQALIQPRPQRPAYSPDDAAGLLYDEVAAGRVDRDAASAVVETATALPGRTVLPAGLSDREVEVLVLVARGRTHDEISTELLIPASAVRDHSADIVEKTAAGSRAAAAVFAMENDLLRS
jgi:HD-GYP domain-containing protein (c-di-GMP phosphodiesterase class II)